MPTYTSAVAKKIASHPNLMAKVEAMLPAGTTLDKAATGFRNQGQFIAALHASQNLGVSFTDLKTQMVDNGFSLGQSIQKVKGTTPTDATTAATQAEQQATIDIKITVTTTSSTGSTSTTTTSTGTTSTGTSNTGTTSTASPTTTSTMASSTMSPSRKKSGKK